VDSAAFSTQIMDKIINIAGQLSSRQMRTVPHFNDFLVTLNYVITYKRDNDFISNWLKGLNEIASSQTFTNDNIDKYLRNSGLLVKENVLSESGNVKWKVKKNSLKFLFDTTVYVPISNATLTCYAQKDSTELYNATGNYYPELQQFRGTKGVVTWEKAGFSGKEVFAELSDYSINMLKSSFTVDSARLTHTTYFKEPVAGLLSDQAISFTDKNKADFPVSKLMSKNLKSKIFTRALIMKED